MERREQVPARTVGRYAIFDVIATGGMATVCFGRLLGPKGFSRTVVVKRLHPQLAFDPDVSTMFQDEARLAARIRHPNVVPVIDVVEGGGELLLVMEYVHGESLAYLARAGERHGEARTRIVTNVVAEVLHGLHAAHEATGENGKPLGVVHRDVSPQNILVGADGVARVLDFGVAKAAGQSHATAIGQVKGKIRFLAPEQVVCSAIDRRADVWGAAVVLWEALANKRLFSGDNDAAVMMEILHKEIPSPRVHAPEVPEEVASVILRGLSRDPEARFPTALAMAEALEAATGLVSAREIGAWVEQVAGERLAARRRVLDDIEAETLIGPVEHPNERPTVPVPRPPLDSALTAAPAIPSLPPPPLLVARSPQRRSLAVVLGVAAAVALAAGFMTVRAMLHDRSAPVAAPAEIAPLVSPEPPSAPTPPPSAAPAPPPAPPPPVSASAPVVAPRAPAPPPRERPSASPRAEFRVPLYGRD